MTSLSVGQIIRELLLEDKAVAKAVNKIFPVATDTANAPYLFYDEEVEHTPTKSLSGVDKAKVNISVVAVDFDDFCALCEKVRAALDYRWCISDGLKVDDIVLTEASKTTWEGDAFLRTLTFSMRVTSK